MLGSGHAWGSNESYGGASSQKDTHANLVRPARQAQTRCPKSLVDHYRIQTILIIRNPKTKLQVGVEARNVCPIVAICCVLFFAFLVFCGPLPFLWGIAFSLLSGILMGLSVM